MKLQKDNFYILYCSN